MHKTKYFAFILMLLSSTTLLQAQSGTNSPYTRYGYGDINTTSYSAARAMGGIGIGFRAKGSINPINPASYSNVDTLTFMFDLGISGNYTMYKTNSEENGKFNGSFDYISLLFPVTKWMGISLGVNPYSMVGYNFSAIDTLQANTPQNDSDESELMQYSYNGNGGLSQIYLGASAKFLKHISLGVNAYYLFGNITHYKESQQISNDNNYTAYQQDNLYINDFRFRFGGQYFTNFNKKHDLTVGLIYEFKSGLSGDYEFTTATKGISSETDETSEGFDFPSLYGAGFYYTYNKKFSIGADFSYQDWKDAQYYGVTDTLASVSKINIGAEYLHDPFSKKFHNRIRYRAGATLYNSYVKMDDGFNNFSVTLGAGIPFRRNASMLNIGLEYGEMGNKSNIKENYFKISLSTTFVERWFLKNVIR